MPTPSIIEITAMKNTIGFMHGKVTLVNVWNLLAPSISAASITSTGTPVMPAII